MSSIPTILPKMSNMSSLTLLTAETRIMNYVATEAIAYLAYMMSTRFRLTIASIVLFAVGTVIVVDAKLLLPWSNALLTTLKTTLNSKVNTIKFLTY